MGKPRGTLRPGWRVIAAGTALVLVFAACTRAEQVAPTTQADPDTIITADGVEVPKPPPPAPIAPVLRKPGPPGDALVGVPTLLGGLVLARQPITRLELWNGSELVESVDYEDSPTEVRSAWQWIPPEAGLFGLVLRAFDNDGGVATSFPLWVRARNPETPDGVNLSARPAAATGRLLGVRTTPVDNLLALRYPDPGPPGISVDSTSCEAKLLVQGVGDAKEVSGIGVYAASFGSTGFVPVGLLSPKGGEVSLLVGSSPIMVYTEVFDEATGTPSPPVVLAPNPACALAGWTGALAFVDGVLQNPKGADRAYLYVSDDGGESWNRVPSTDQTFIYPNADGAFDFSGAIAPTTSGLLLEAWGWVGGVLTPLGRGQWTASAPSGGTSGVTPKVDIVGPSTAGMIVPNSNFDWSIGSTGNPVLIRSGTICTYKPQQPVQSTTTTIGVTIAGGSTTPPTTAPPQSGSIGILPDSCTNAPFGAYSKVFRWEPLPGTISHGLLQVSTLPPPADAVLSFPGLIHTQTVAAPQGAYTDFDVPLKDLISPPPASASFGDQALGGASVVTFDMIAGLGSTDAGGSIGGDGKWIKLIAPLLVQGKSNKTFYLRVIPMKDATTPQLGVSNGVVIQVDDTPPLLAPPQPAQPSAMSLTVQMTPPHLPNPAYDRCVRVIENPWGSKNPDPSLTPLWSVTHKVPIQFYLPGSFAWAENAAFIFENGVKVHKGLIPGSTVCAQHLDPPEKDAWDYLVDAVNFVGWVWDMYVGVWDMMKGWAADVIAYASGCVTLAEASGKSTAEAEKVCSGWATTGINITLAAFGIPPTMPKFKDLVELGKGEIKAYLIKLAKDQGVLDCGVVQSQCDEMADKFLSELLGQMQVAATQAATSSAVVGSQWVLSIHPGIYVIPEPASTLSPALFSITLTRSTNPLAPLPPATCTYTARVFGDKDSYAWQNYYKGYWQTGKVSTSAVVASDSTTIALSGMKPGESRSTSIVLNTVVPWYPEGQNPQLPNVPYWSVKPQTWIFFTTATPSGLSPTTLTTSLSGGPNCGTVSQVFAQDKESTEPWEIP